MLISPDITIEDRREVAGMLRNEGFTDECKDKVMYVLNIDMLDADDVDFASCLADFIDQPTTVMKDLGEYTPRHKFRRMECKRCGAVHWEQPNDRLRMSYCPYCGAAVTLHAE